MQSTFAGRPALGWTGPSALARRARRMSEVPGEEVSVKTWIPDKTWREECGVFAAAGVPRAAEVVGLGLHALQHRGQESCGIVSCDEGDAFHGHKGLGLSLKYS